MAIKGKQKAGAAKKRKTKSEGRVIRKTSPGPSPVSTPELSTPSRPSIALDIASHPYILQQIINESSPSTLVALLQCSKHTFQFAAPALYQYPRMTGEQFTAMIATGNSPAKRGASSGLLGRGFSPFLREALRHVRSLHIVDFHEKTVGPPSIPRNTLSTVDSVVIHPIEGWYIRKQILFPKGFLAMKPTRLYLRLPPSHRPSTYRNDFLRSKLHQDIRQIHCLVSARCEVRFAPLFSCVSYESDPRDKHLSITVVLLPRPPGVLAPAVDYRMAPPHHPSGMIHDRFCDDLVIASRYCTIRLVGGEYFGLFDEGRSVCVLKTTVNQHSTPAPSLTFSRFREWLDEQEPGAVFSAEEEREQRALDEGYIAQLEATATAAPA